jgi:hypothetical protein
MSDGVSEAKEGDGGGVVLDLAVSCMIGGGKVGDGGGVPSSPAPSPAPDPTRAAPLGLPAFRFGLSLLAVIRVCWWLV